ncbi:MAG TPA: hypothetical protein DEP66_03525, partial [Acidimicrobiaceae bacterium]|nr:hypothetical protein [Acidimicrobiaceae bacterium]
MSSLHPVLLAFLGAAAVVSCGRWLRVAQREHYLAGWVSRFAWRWWRRDRVNLALLAVAAGGAAGA